MENNQSYLNNEISIFPDCKTVVPPKVFTYGVLLELIREGYFSKEVKKYQALLKSDPQKARSFKSGFMVAITCAGVFAKRNKEGLITPSAIIVLDVDNVSQEQFETIRAALANDKYTSAVMTSPGGQGLKVFVPMYFGHGEETYKHRYNEVLNYYASNYNIPICDKRKKGSSKWGFDASCNDISRLCILGTDIIINDNPEVFEVFQTFSPTETRVRKLIEKIGEQQVDITPSYDEWFRIGCALKREFGEGGRMYFHQVSKFYEKYNEKEADQLFSGIKGISGTPITIATFFEACKQYEVSFNVLKPQVIEISDPPESMIDDTIAVEKFPIEVLPVPIRNFITEAFKSVNCPIDYLGITVLMVISVALGRKYSISPKSGHREFAIFFTAVIGDPGQKKSPAFKVVLQIVYKMQQEYRIQYQKDLDAYELELEIWKEAKKEDPGLLKPVKPIMRRIIASDTTMESLGTLLEENPIGLLLFYDELLAWINAFNQYKGKGNDQQKFLSLWSGTDIQIDRKQQEAKIIVNPFVTITGGIQPDVLKDLSKGRNDGFLDRILFCFPDHITPYYTDDKLDDITVDLFHQKMRELFDRSTDDFESNGFQSFKLMMDQEQFRAWREWVNNHHAETDVAGFPYYFKGPWAKMEAHSLSLILLLAYSRTKSDEKVEIRMVDIEGGIKLAEYFKTHIRRTYQEIYSSEDDKKILKAVEFIKRSGGSTTYRNFYKCGIAGCKNHESTDKLFKEMESRGLGTKGKSAASPGVKRSDVFVLNPVAN